jgi:hypothetical protein
MDEFVAELESCRAGPERPADETTAVVPEAAAPAPSARPVPPAARRPPRRVAATLLPILLGLLVAGAVAAAFVLSDDGRVPLGGAESSAAIKLQAVLSYDPDGDGEENDALAASALADQDPATNWTTVCYQETLMGKSGVGLVVTLSHAATGELSFDVDNPPFQVEVFGSDAAEIPAEFDDWGPALQNKTVSDVPGPVHVATPVPVRHVLIALREIGRDPGCSTANPNRGSIGEITFG